MITILIQYLSVNNIREKTERIKYSFKINHDLRNLVYCLSDLISKYFNIPIEIDALEIDNNNIIENEILSKSNDYQEIMQSIKIIN